MKTVQIGEHVIEMYDSMHVMPANRESLMSYFQLMESGIGASWESIDSHLNGLLMAVAQDDKPSVFQAVENLRMCYWLTLSQYNAAHLGWLCSIHSVDGKPISTEEDSLKELSRILGEHPGDAEFAWDQFYMELKKKLPTSFESTFQNGQQTTSTIG